MQQESLRIHLNEPDRQTVKARRLPGD